MRSNINPFNATGLPQKHPNISSVIIFSGGIERDKWPEIGQYHRAQEKKKKKKKQFKIMPSYIHTPQAKVLLYLTISMSNKIYNLNTGSNINSVNLVSLYI